MEGYLFESLNDGFFSNKAKNYVVKRVGESTYIAPASEQIERIKIDLSNSGILYGFLELASYCAMNCKLLLTQGHHMHTDKKMERKRREELDGFADAAAKFATRWGLFGVFFDRGELIFSKVTSGGRISSAIPQMVYVPPNNMRSDLFTSEIESGIFVFSDYIKEFFPFSNESFQNNSEWFAKNYCEDIYDMLLNPRFLSVVKYIQDVGEEINPYMQICGVNMTLFHDVNGPHVRQKNKSLISYCQTAYFLDILRGNNGRYGVCGHALCKRPFLRTSDNKEYCNSQCRKAASMYRYRHSEKRNTKPKEGKTNAQETRE